MKKGNRLHEGGDMWGPVSDVLRAARMVCQKSQLEMADALQVSRSTIKRWERGEGTMPDIEQLVRICMVARVTPNHLLDSLFPGGSIQKWWDALPLPPYREQQSA